MFGDTTKLYDIPITHLDYKYITNCQKIKELERILKVLRSGSEGSYPDLEQHCEEKIRTLNPESRLLYKPGKLISATDLSDDEREYIEEEFCDWLEESKHKQDVSKLFLPIDEDETNSTIPKVRGSGSICPLTGIGRKEKQSSVKSNVPRSYEDWAKIEKELDKEICNEDDFKENVSGTTVSTPGVAGDTPSKHKILSGLKKTAGSLPLSVRQVYAQREKEKGNEAYSAGDLTEALLYYDRSLLYHELAAVYNNRALIYLKQKKWKYVIKDCSRVLQEEPANIKGLFRRARAYYELHSLEKSENDLKEILNQEPNNEKVLELLRNVRDDHASRQKSRLEGGRRMVIDEVASSSSESETENDEDEDAADELRQRESDHNSEDTSRSVREPSPARKGVIIEEVEDERVIHFKSRMAVPKNQIRDEHKKISPNVDKKEQEFVNKSNAAVISSAAISSDSGSDKEKKKAVELIEQLKINGLEKFKKALGIKLDADLLEQYVYAIKSICLPQGEFEFIFKLLECLSKSPRFNVAILLLDCNAAGALHTMFEHLQNSEVLDSHDVMRLRDLYLV